jgi:hypothetical protein
MAMTHESYVRQNEPQGSSNRGFGLVFSAVFAILAVMAYFSISPVIIDASIFERCPFISRYPNGAVLAGSILFLSVSLGFLVLALVLPKSLAPLNWGWTKIGLLLHKIVSPIVLGVLFFLVFTPTGVVMRLFGGDPLRLRLEPKTVSYWIERSPPGPAPDSLKDQF